MKLLEQNEMPANNEILHEGEIGLRYSREERLKKAPEAVRQMHDEGFIVKPGLIGSLTATKGSRSILFALVLVLILMLVSLALPSDRKSGKVHGIPVKMQVLTRDSALYVSIIFDAVKEVENQNLPISVYATILDSQKKMLSAKTVETIYIGTKNIIPLKFPVDNAVRLDTVIVVNEKELHLHTRL